MKSIEKLLIILRKKNKNNGLDNLIKLEKYFIQYKNKKKKVHHILESNINRSRSNIMIILIRFLPKNPMKKNLKYFLL